MALRKGCRLLKQGKTQCIFTVTSLLFVVFVCKKALDDHDLDSDLDPDSDPYPHQEPRFSHRLGETDDLHHSRVVAPHHPIAPGHSSSSPGAWHEGLVFFERNVPLIWIGGVPRSGTTLMRAVLDAHPEVRCGAETRVIPRLLNMHHWLDKTDFERNWLRDVNLSNEILERALGAYILSIIAGHGEAAARLCNNDPFALRSIDRLHRVFPRSKFLLMIRDGRATVHSIISRKITIKGFDFRSYRRALRDWNRVVTTMYQQCRSVGSEHCLPVYYERLILHPKQTMTEVLQFLGVPWNDVVLHHETTIGQEGGVFLSK